MLHFTNISRKLDAKYYQLLRQFCVPHWEEVMTTILSLSEGFKSAAIPPKVSVFSQENKQIHLWSFAKGPLASLFKSSQSSFDFFYILSS